MNLNLKHRWYNNHELSNKKWSRQHEEKTLQRFNIKHSVGVINVNTIDIISDTILVYNRVISFVLIELTPRLLPTYHARCIQQ